MHTGAVPVMGRAFDTVSAGIPPMPDAAFVMRCEYPLSPDTDGDTLSIVRVSASSPCLCIPLCVHAVCTCRTIGTRLQNRTIAISCKLLCIV